MDNRLKRLWRARRRKQLGIILLEWFLANHKDENYVEFDETLVKYCEMTCRMPLEVNSLPLRNAFAHLATVRYGKVSLYHQLPVILSSILASSNLNFN